MSLYNMGFLCINVIKDWVHIEVTDTKAFMVFYETRLVTPHMAVGLPETLLKF